MSDSPISSEERSRFPIPLWKIIGLSLLIGVVALLWIRKEVYHDQLSRQVLAFEKKETELLTEAGHLQQQYMLLSESSHIEKLAREQLNMEFPKTASDTVWIPKSDKK